MTYLILGLLIFLGVHSVRLLAEDWRTRTRARLGAGPWRLLYSLASLAGFVLLVWGFGLARQQPLQLWSPPLALRHLAGLLNLGAFVLLAAAYVPGNHLKARLHHPMALGTALWALAHLLANGNLAHVILFGAFLVWGLLAFRGGRQRDRRDGTRYRSGAAAYTAVSLVLGVAAWLGFALWLHGWLIGVRPLG